MPALWRQRSQGNNYGTCNFTFEVSQETWFLLSPCTTLGHLKTKWPGWLLSCCSSISLLALAPTTATAHICRSLTLEQHLSATKFCCMVLTSLLEVRCDYSQEVGAHVFIRKARNAGKHISLLTSHLKVIKMRCPLAFVSVDNCSGKRLIFSYYPSWRLSELSDKVRTREGRLCKGY